MADPQLPLNHAFADDPWCRGVCDVKVDEDGRVRTCGRPEREHQEVVDAPVLDRVIIRVKPEGPYVELVSGGSGAAGLLTPDEADTLAVLLVAAAEKARRP